MDAGATLVGIRWNLTSTRRAANAIPDPIRLLRTDTGKQQVNKPPARQPMMEEFTAHSKSNQLNQFKPPIHKLRRDQRAVASLHGLPVGPLSLSTSPVPLRNRALVTNGLHCANARASVASLAPALRYFLRPCPPRFGIAPLPSPTSQPKRHQRRASPLLIRLKSRSHSRWSIGPVILWQTTGKASLQHIWREAIPGLPHEQNAYWKARSLRRKTTTTECCKISAPNRTR